MALMAFTSFPLLVAGSVALSNGTEVAPWQPAMAQDPQGPQRSAHSGRADDAAQPVAPSLFAATPDHAAISAAQDTSLVSLSNKTAVANGSSGAGGAAFPPVSSAEHAPPIFDGELPVNTLIAPAQPVIVLKGGEFGWRTAPDDGRHELHNGTDISAPEGSPVVAAMDGTVTAVFWDVWGGNRVEVSHANGMKTTYNHMSKVMVRVGDHLKASEQLGAVGHTGLRVTGPHLHFETWVNGKVVDPQSFDWKVGEKIIPASRPAYSNADQAGAAQPPAATRPGTDGGHAPKKAPAKSQDQIRALGQKTAPAKETSKGQKKAPAKKPATTPSQGSGNGRTVADGSGKQPPKTGAPSKPHPPVVHPPKTPTVPRPSAGKPDDGAKPGPVPQPKRPVKDKPPVTPPEPKPVDPRVAPINSLGTKMQLQQRTQATVGAHLALPEKQQVEAYRVGSPLDVELKALLAQGSTLKVPTTDPYMVKLLAASNAVTAASPPPGSTKPVNSALTKAATDALAALRAEALRAPVYRPAAATVPGAATNPGAAAPGAAAPAAPAAPGAGAPAAPVK
ncbi:peptidase M23 [Kocuria tytonicola]|uniref:M23 family metallopeptidase n=1 Tax=Kocuria tytonicola TaxID=2055946 RepID=UPI000EF931CC|nr:M23 family metallopeptidase [Kocuria tytonicola]RLZ04461.1 peptidase M23 [Kocuria tytonicola]